MFDVYLPFVSAKTQESATKQLADLIKNHVFQGRSNMQFDPLLERAAQLHCEDMVRRDYFSHLSPEGTTANERLRLVGFKLPDYYKTKENNVESLAAGTEKPDRIFEMLINSAPHRPHILGHGFFSTQNLYGIGFAQSEHGAAKYQFYWSIVTAQWG